ncbi:hypothetical protein NPIL_47401 [Nephila pilipes]|uniref:Protein RED C-terminal domain-containing protein n=1 Tax=Nephila pilipes TaxID=299642 RepID=A0A8X6QVF6_NEPPI|nr:hypothetical protein NPIL_47401 [Nephila pilipes]
MLNGILVLQNNTVNNKGALPKATFRYGAKITDGRKTKITKSGKRDEKTKWFIIDREAFCDPDTLKNFDILVCAASIQVIKYNNHLTYLTNSAFIVQKYQGGNCHCNGMI